MTCELKLVQMKFINVNLLQINDWLTFCELKSTATRNALRRDNLNSSQQSKTFVVTSVVLSSVCRSLEKNYA